MSSTRTDLPLLGLLLVLIALCGCIADTAEDSDLPWSSNQSWEGLAPVAPSVLDRYE